MCGCVSGNRALFGQSGAVAPLVSYLTTSDLEVHRSTSVALFQLSKDPWNCVTMHQNGVVPHLLRLIGMYEKYEFPTKKLLYEFNSPLGYYLTNSIPHMETSLIQLLMH